MPDHPRTPCSPPPDTIWQLPPLAGAPSAAANLAGASLHVRQLSPRAAREGHWGFPWTAIARSSRHCSYSLVVSPPGRAAFECARFATFRKARTLCRRGAPPRIALRLDFLEAQPRLAGFGRLALVVLAKMTRACGAEMMVLGSVHDAATLRFYQGLGGIPGRVSGWHCDPRYLPFSFDQATVQRLSGVLQP